MKFIDFYQQFYRYGLVDVRNAMTLFSKLDRRRLFEWQQKGYIKKIASNFYRFSDFAPDDNFIRYAACKIYQPSYIGLESALSYYGLIPELVFQTTCISTNKTRKIQNKEINLHYRCVKKPLFWGYRLEGKKPFEYFISTPEKTIIDFLYFKKGLLDENYFEQLRINADQLLKVVDKKKLILYLRLFKNEQFKDRFIHFLRHYRVGI